MGEAGALAIRRPGSGTSPAAVANVALAVRVASARPSTCALVNRAVQPCARLAPPLRPSAGAVTELVPSESVIVPEVASCAAGPPSVNATSLAPGKAARPSTLTLARLLEPTALAAPGDASQPSAGPGESPTPSAICVSAGNTGRCPKPIAWEPRRIAFLRPISSRPLRLRSTL